jgi:uncharacterized membrane protein
MTKWDSDELSALHAGVMAAASKAATDGAAWQATQDPEIFKSELPVAEETIVAAKPPQNSSSGWLATASDWLTTVSGGQLRPSRIFLFGALAATFVTAAIFVKVQQEKLQGQADPAEQEQNSYRDSMGDIGRLQLYVRDCLICTHKIEAVEQISRLEQVKTAQEEQTYRNARGDATRLGAYLSSCETCAFASEARNEISSLQKATTAQQEDQTYRKARGNIDLLKDYVRGCTVCRFESAARNEISQLEHDAKFVTFEVCNKTSYLASVALNGRKNPDSTEWTVQGWWSVAPGTCRKTTKFAKGHVYAMARVYGATKGWRESGTKKCVEFPGPFERVESPGYNCRANEKLESFKDFFVNDNFTWTLSEEPRESDEFFTFEVCNKSYTWAAVAVSGIEIPQSGAWVVQGWWRVGPGQCEEIGKFVRGAFYAVAEQVNNSRSGWKGNDLRLCVEHPGPFKRINRGGEQCSSDDLQSFRKFVVTEDRQRWNLLP